MLSKRDSELQKIREGEFAAKKPKLMTQEEQDRAFKNYMKMFYDKPRLTVSYKFHAKPIRTFRCMIF